MAKPNVFRWGEAARFGSAMAAVALVAFAFSLGVWASAALISFPAFAWFARLIIRSRFIKRSRYVTSHGIVVMQQRDLSISQDAVEHLTAVTIDRWLQVTKWEGVQNAIESGTLWVLFKRGAAKHDGFVDRMMRRFLGRSIVIGYADRNDLSHTSFEHELGHVIYEAWRGDADVLREHRYIRAHNLK